MAEAMAQPRGPTRAQWQRSQKPIHSCDRPRAPGLWPGREPPRRKVRYRIWLEREKRYWELNWKKHAGTNYFTPVQDPWQSLAHDGSVLKHDMKQRRVKIRREEQNRLNEVNKEMHLLEKERRSKRLYQAHMEEKQRKLREQKERVEQRRVAAEIKRKKKLQKEMQKYEAIVLRTQQRSNRVDRHEKRWSQEDPVTLNPESRGVNKPSIRAKKLDQENSHFSRHTFTSSTGHHHNLPKRTAEEKKSFSRTTNGIKLPPSLQMEEQPVDENLCGINLFQTIKTALRILRNNQLKTTVMVPGSRVEMPLQAKTVISPTEKVKMSSKPDVEVLPEVVEKTSLEANRKAPSKAGIEVSPKANGKMLPEVSVIASHKAVMEKLPKACMESPIKASVELPPGASVKMATKFRLVTSPIPGMESSSSAEVRDSSQISEIDKQISIPVIKKHLSSNIPSYRWLSSVSGWYPSFPKRSIQENHPLLPLPGISKQSATPSFLYKAIPVQQTMSTINALISTTRKEKDTVANMVNKCEALRHKNMTDEEPSVKSTAGTVNVKKATEILAERSFVDQPRGKEVEERSRKEMEESVIRKMKPLDKEASKGLGCNFLTSENDKGDGQQPKDIKLKKECQASETSGNIMFREEETDDERETRSNDDSSDDVAPSDIYKDTDSSKLNKQMNIVKKNLPKLIFLCDNGLCITEENRLFKSNVKISKTNAKDPSKRVKLRHSVGLL